MDILRRGGRAARLSTTALGRARHARCIQVHRFASELYVPASSCPRSPEL